MNVLGERWSERTVKFLGGVSTDSGALPPGGNLVTAITFFSRFGYGCYQSLRKLAQVKLVIGR
ncbi:hypothetical protein [Synechococcus sp. HK01-R]|jgi:hypothetical protein|uniref:hypothetical protein n=1 Tax=Synechococcus sp. HK01-R TaxID=2751171 RepID=UPI001623EC9D|nr:hypothetical protein [Synechococcus sp. HK01-R]QNG27447.1 hypothetical protein H0O21_02105 [Synechococcus sp. HK01-R]